MHEPAYAAALDRLLKHRPRAGRCERCRERVRCFTIPRAEDALHAGSEAHVRAIIDSLRWGCPKCDIWVTSEIDEYGVTAVLRDVSDPFWAWAPEAWRPALVAYGFGVHGSDFRLTAVRFGEADGSVWATDDRVVVRLPPGTTLAQVEEAYGLKVTTGPADIVSAIQRIRRERDEARGALQHLTEERDVWKARAEEAERCYEVARRERGDAQYDAETTKARADKAEADVAPLDRYEDE